MRNTQFRDSNDCFGNFVEVCFFRQPIGTCPSLGFTFISNDNIAVRQDLMQLSSKGLRDVGGQKIQSENLEIG